MTYKENAGYCRMDRNESSTSCTLVNALLQVLSEYVLGEGSPKQHRPREGWTLEEIHHRKANTFVRARTRRVK